MKLIECDVKIRCDMPNCRNMAKYKLNKAGFVKNAGLFFCKECVKEMYDTLSQHIIPKSPSNVLNKKVVNSKSKGELNE